MKIKKISGEEDFPKEIFSLLFSIESKHFWFDGRNNVISAFIKNIISNRKDLSFIDIGCGTGYVLPCLEKLGFSVTGLDMYEEGLRLARERSKSPLIRADFNSVNLKKQYDAVGVFDVLEHIDDEIAFLKNCKKILKKNGWIFLTVPAFMSLWSKHDVVAGHKRRYAKKSLVKLFSQNGFNIQKIEYFGFFHFFPLLLFKKYQNQHLERIKNDPIEITKYTMKIPPYPINKLLQYLFVFENRLMNFFSFPFGSSIILSAKKKD